MSQKFTGGYRISLTNQLNSTSESVRLGVIGLEIVKVLSEYLAPVVVKFTEDELDEIRDMQRLKAHNIREPRPRSELLEDAKHWLRGEKVKPQLLKRIQGLNDNECWLLAASTMFNEISPSGGIKQFTDTDTVTRWLTTHPEDIGDAMKHIHRVDVEYQRQLEKGTYTRERFLKWKKSEAEKARLMQAKKAAKRAKIPTGIDFSSIRMVFDRKADPAANPA